MINSLINSYLHTRMRVDDLEKTVSFYKNILGFEETRRSESPRGSKMVFLKIPNSEVLLEITYYPDSGPVQVQPDLMHLAFEVNDLEEFRNHIKGNGIEFSEGPTTSKSTGTTFAFIDAPEGYEIEIIQKK